MYKLYWSDDTGAFVVHAALSEAGADYELVKLDYRNGEHKKEPYLFINPAGEVPALQLHDGSILTETVAIILHIAENFPRAALLPESGSKERAVAYRWLLFMATKTYAHDLRYYYPQRYTDEPDQTEGIKSAALEMMTRSFDTLEQVLEEQDYLAGSKISIADTYLTMMSQWHPDVAGLLENCPNIRRVADAVRQRPAIAAIWDENFTGD